MWCSSEWVSVMMMYVLLAVSSLTVLAWVLTMVLLGVLSPYGRLWCLGQ